MTYWERGHETTQGSCRIQKKKALAIATNNPHVALNKHILIKLLMEILKHTQQLTEKYTEP